ncbi:hypothetical protein [Ideonella sp. BN130291]|uniref:hypothetical protein n=1 Tax=Ideonella sp. BN130291 TaxID=3112940 RepID=UPI002E272FDE|nr:hypothetical protein [Ideonella sp. BN130291]
MELALYLAAAATLAIGIAHSYMGERYLLMRLFRREDLPKLFGSTDYTRRTLRFAWHVTTVAWWGFGALLVLLAHPPVSAQAVGMVIGAVFLLHFAIALFGSRGRHYSWVAFLVIGVLATWATR